MRRIYPAIALVLSLILASSLVLIRQDVVAQEEGGEPVEVDVVDVLTAPEEFFNHDVRVEGEVGEILTSDAFTISSESEDGLELVIAAPPEMIPDDLSPDTQVTAEGIVRQLNQEVPLVTEDGEDLGISPYQRAFERYEGDPVVVASGLSVEGEPVENDFGLDLPEATVANIADDPSTFRNREVTVRATIAEHVADGAWSITTDDTDVEVLVLTAPDNVPAGLTDDALVRASGTVVWLDPELDYELNGQTLSLEGDAFDDWSDEPAIIADSLNMVAPALDEMVEDILDDPETYMGERVLVLGTVDSVGGNQAFAFDGPEGFLGLSEETLLVVGSADVVPDGIVDEAIVQVSGTVREFDPDDPSEWGGGAFQIEPGDEEFEPNYDEFLARNDEDFLDDYEDEPVIVADSVQVLAQEPGDTVEDILDDPAAFIGEPVTVAGVVEEDLTRQGFTLDGTEAYFGLTEENLLVIGPTDIVEGALVSEDVVVVVSGTVEYFEGDVADEFVGDVLENPDLLRDFTDEPAIFAESIMVIANE